MGAFAVTYSIGKAELTESATYDNMEHMLSVLQELKDRGFKISMDEYEEKYLRGL